MRPDYFPIRLQLSHHMTTFDPESGSVPRGASPPAGAALEAVFAAFFPHPEGLYSFFSRIASVVVAT